MVATVKKCEIIGALEGTENDSWFEESDFLDSHSSNDECEVEHEDYWGCCDQKEFYTTVLDC
jgi:hypothetical protein